RGRAPHRRRRLAAPVDEAHGLSTHVAISPLALDKPVGTFSVVTSAIPVGATSNACRRMHTPRRLGPPRRATRIASASTRDPAALPRCDAVESPAAGQQPAVHWPGSVLLRQDLDAFGFQLLQFEDEALDLGVRSGHGAGGALG